LMVTSVVPLSPRVVGGNHLKFSVRNARGGGGRPLDVIAFQMGERLGELGEGSIRDLVFTPEINVWQGQERLQLRLKDFRAGGVHNPVRDEKEVIVKPPSARPHGPAAEGR
ncbi:MAG TPA: hypothetical protein VIU33_02355, partial [Nitrospiria bacterium]